MKNAVNNLGLKLATILLFSTLFTFCSSPVESDTMSSNQDLEKVLESMSVEDLSDDEIDGLKFMREEEKLARDVYLTMYEIWNLRVFNNISKSEQKHMDAIKVLFDRYSLEDPVMEDAKGKFVNEDLQKLYNELVEKGSESIIAGLMVGAAIEEIDILDLEEQINKVVDNEDLIFVYGNLHRASKNHLRAFVRNINKNGATYKPQYLSEEAYEEIINSENERGGNGRGKKRGQGKR